LDGLGYKIINSGKKISAKFSVHDPGTMQSGGKETRRSDSPIRRIGVEAGGGSKASETRGRDTVRREIIILDSMKL
jgi:hypothetical protein